MRVPHHDQESGSFRSSDIYRFLSLSQTRLWGRGPYKASQAQELGCENLSGTGRKGSRVSPKAERALTAFFTNMLQVVSVHPDQPECSSPGG